MMVSLRSRAIDLRSEGEIDGSWMIPGWVVGELSLGLVRPTGIRYGSAKGAGDYGVQSEATR